MINGRLEKQTLEPRILDKSPFGFPTGLENFPEKPTKVVYNIDYFGFDAFSEGDLSVVGDFLR